MTLIPIGEANGKNPLWQKVNHPLQPDDPLPAERKVVLVWLRAEHLPFCGYIRYAAGDPDCPYFVVYHGNTDLGAEVVAWCDCLPEEGPPDIDSARSYTYERNKGRGLPARGLSPRPIIP